MTNMIVLSCSCHFVTATSFYGLLILLFFIFIAPYVQCGLKLASNKLYL